MSFSISHYLTPFWKLSFIQFHVLYSNPTIREVIEENGLITMVELGWVNLV